MVKAVGLGLIALLASTGCSPTPRTEVVLVVDTDLRGPGGVDTFYVEVTSPKGELQSATAMVADGALPRTLGLVHEGGRLGPYTARVEGRSGVTPLVSRRARFSFQEGRTLMVRVDLLAACVASTCTGEETCAAGGCRSIDLAPEELVEWTGTPAPLDVDAAVPPVDAGGDGGGGPVDGGPPPSDGGGVDGGRDAGCSADLTTDVLNCGACGHACDFQHATGSCIAGMCTVTACDTGWDDCNTMGDDGCEADLMMSDATCGTCGTRCVGVNSCCMGTCQRTCP